LIDGVSLLITRIKARQSNTQTMKSRGWEE